MSLEPRVWFSFSFLIFIIQGFFGGVVGFLDSVCLRFINSLTLRLHWFSLICFCFLFVFISIIISVAFFLVCKLFCLFFLYIFMDFVIMLQRRSLIVADTILCVNFMIFLFGYFWNCFIFYFLHLIKKLSTYV